MQTQALCLLSVGLTAAAPTGLRPPGGSNLGVVFICVTFLALVPTQSQFPPQSGVLIQRCPRFCHHFPNAEEEMFKRQFSDGGGALGWEEP